MPFPIAPVAIGVGVLGAVGIALRIKKQKETAAATPQTFRAGTPPEIQALIVKNMQQANGIGVQTPQDARELENAGVAATKQGFAITQEGLIPLSELNSLANLTASTVRRNADLAAGIDNTFNVFADALNPSANGPAINVLSAPNDSAPSVGSVPNGGLVKMLRVIDGNPPSLTGNDFAEVQTTSGLRGFIRGSHLLMA